MGTGIMGAIPISFRFDGRYGSYSSYMESEAQDNKKEFIKHAPKDFFDFYNEAEYEEEIGNKTLTLTYYEIKPEILLPNFKDFFIEFHKLIGSSPVEIMDGCAKFNDKYDAIVAAGDIDGFIKYFKDKSGCAPSIFPYFGPAYIANSTNLLVYQGSYKAFLEEWSTLFHMERMLWKAMEHPLAKVMRFGMSL
ncbi:MAG: hypothetical protein LBF89_10205 [Bacteroidales bacterium]|jgi:hypothetical protein|nr:hypothetical protein [Bacteroidales bacterium]